MFCNSKQLHTEVHFPLVRTAQKLNCHFIGGHRLMWDFYYTTLCSHPDSAPHQCKLYQSSLLQYYSWIVAVREGLHGEAVGIYKTKFLFTSPNWIILKSFTLMQHENRPDSVPPFTDSSPKATGKITLAKKTALQLYKEPPACALLYNSPKAITAWKIRMDTHYRSAQVLGAGQELHCTYVLASSVLKCRQGNQAG